MTDEPNTDATPINPYQQELSGEPAEPNDQPPVGPPGPLVPPLWVWLVVAFMAAMIILVRVKTVTGDHAVVNILTMLLSFLGFCAVSFWFLFFSGYSRACRLGSLAGFVVCVALFFTAFRVEQVSGEMIPTFRARSAPPADSLLDSPDEVAGSAEIDLATTSEQDFPQFLGSQRNGTVSEIQLARDWQSNPPQLLWRQPIGAGWSGFAAVHGYAVTLEQRGDQKLVTCYEMATGKLVWAQSTANRHSTVLGGTGPSTPTIHDGKVYTLGPSGNLLCLDGSTGDIVWQDNLLSRYNVPPGEDGQAVAWGRANSPLVVDDLVVIPAGGPKDGPHVSLAAFNRLTGELVWEAGSQQVSYASPALAVLGNRRMIVIVNENNVSGHEPETGQELWQVKWPGNSAANASVSQASLLRDGRLLLSKGYGVGAALWQLAEETDGTITTTELWSDSSMLKTKFTNHVIGGDYVFALSDGILECVELESGKRQWKKGRYGHGQILLTGDVLLVQAESGEVLMVEPTPDKLREIAKFAAIDGKTWNNLCLSGDLLLVRNAEEAACYRLPTTP